MFPTKVLPTPNVALPPSAQKHPTRLSAVDDHNSWSACSCKGSSNLKDENGIWASLSVQGEHAGESCRALEAINTGNKNQAPKVCPVRSVWQGKALAWEKALLASYWADWATGLPSDIVPLNTPGCLCQEIHKSYRQRPWDYCWWSLLHQVLRKIQRFRGLHMCEQHKQEYTQIGTRKTLYCYFVEGCPLQIDKPKVNWEEQRILIRRRWSAFHPWL